MQDPALSILMVVPHHYSLLERTLGHLARQTIQNRLELVFIVSDAVRVPTQDLSGYWGVQVLEFGPIMSTGEALAEGVRRARAPIVVPAEDHSFPEPDWAEQLLAAHAGPYAAVGPLVVNGNPERLESWASLLHFHGRFAGWNAPQELERLPGHQTSYKRAVLAEVPDLGFYLNQEALLFPRLCAAGHRLLLHPAARVRHLQCSTLAAFVLNHLVSARRYAAARCQSWSVARRLLYLFGSPMLVGLKLYRMHPDVVRSRSAGGYWPQILPYLWLGASCAAAGESLGYILGPGSAERLKFGLEYDRHRWA